MDFYTTAWNLWPCKRLCEHNWSCSDYHFDRHGYLLFTYRKKKWPFSGIFIRKLNSIHKTFLLCFKLTIGLVIIDGLLKFFTNSNTSRQIRFLLNLQVFYFTHLLFIVYLGLLIIHAPEFWKWLLIPGLIYIVERIYRTIATTVGSGKSHIVEGNVLPSR